MRFPKPFKKVGSCFALMFVRGAKKGSIITKWRPKTKYRGAVWASSRLSYHLNKKKIPRWSTTKWALHTCDRPWCVNPKHIYIGTPSDNITDTYKRNPALRASRLGNKNMLGKTHSKETRRKLSLASMGFKRHLGFKHSEETKKRISDKKKEYYRLKRLERT